MPALRYGQNIEVDARVRRPRNYGNPGDFDFEHFLARQNIYWTASGAANTVRILPGRCGSPIVKAAMDLRAAVMRRTEELYRGDDYLAGMMQAMLMGQNFQLQRIWTEEYRNTGTFHVIVISGTHIAILAAFFLFLLRVCFVPRSIAMLLTSLAAWLYAMTSGWGAPCTRCAAGLTLYMIGRYFYRERRALNLLAAIALGFLAVDPDQLFNPAFNSVFSPWLSWGPSRRPWWKPLRALWRAGWAICATLAAISISRRAWRSFESKCVCWWRRCTFPRLS